MKLNFFEQSVYHTRRSTLAHAIQSGLILIPSNEEAGINYKDNTYPFRQDSSFLYYCGIDRPGLNLLIDSQTGESFLMGDEASIEDIVWTGPVPSLQQLADHAAIDRVISTAQGLDWIRGLQAHKVPIHYLPIYRGDHAFRLADLLGLSPEKIAANYSRLLAAEVVKMREIKSAQEISELNKAINLSGIMHHTMMTTTRTGMTEAHVAALVRAECIKADVDIPYGMILTINGQTLHNHGHHNSLRSGQLLLGDFGAESPMHYAGDITRTIPVDKTFTSLQRDIYTLVLTTLEQSIQAIKPGVPYLQVHLNACLNITKGLIEMGYLKGDAEEMVQEGVHALFMPHGLGHPLGLDVHDMEGIGEQYTGYDENTLRSTQFGLSALRLGKSLQNGMVITVEPGIYFIPELISLWKSQHKFEDFIDYNAIERAIPFGGIRLENNILVAAEGPRVLGDPIPQSISDVEELRLAAYSL